MPAEFVVAPSWLIPVEPAGMVLENHALVVGEGRILAILPREDARQQWPEAHWLERADHALIPGLINTHTHAAMNLLRGYADDLPLDIWLGEHIWPAESRWTNAEFVRDGVDLAILEMIRGGTTCFQDMYMFPDEVAAVAAERGIRAVTSIIVLEAATPWARDADEYLTKGLAVHDCYRDHPLVSTAFGPHAPYTVGNDAFRRIVTLANQLGMNIQIHLHETATEVAQAEAESGMRPLARLDALGLINTQLNAVHMTQLTPAEIALLAERGVHVVHCPESNMKLASGTCPVAKLLDAGVNVALGTDGAASNNDLDMFGEMRSAALLAKLAADDAQALPADSALRMATLNGAKALGLDSETGSLVAGKAADMVCVNLATLATQPVHNAVSQLVYSASRDQVSDVWVAGRQLYGEDGFTNADEQGVIARANVWLARMQQSS